MQTISDAADVHVTTLFMHFKSKSELALSLVAESVDSLCARAFEKQGNLPVFDFVLCEALDLADVLTASRNPGQSLWHALYTDQELAFAWSEFQREQKAIIAGYVGAEYGLDPELDPRPEIVAALLLTSAFLPLRRWADGTGDANLKDEVIKAASIGERAARTILETAT
jgi:AcrR family transcriptional regulator